MKAAFIGLGVMGYPMAGHLKNAGIDVCVYNRTAEKAQRWVEQYKGSMAQSPAAAASGCDVVLSFYSLYQKLDPMLTWEQIFY